MARYLLKTWLLRGRRADAGAYRAMWEAAMDDVLGTLLAWAPAPGLAYVGQLGVHRSHGPRFHRRMEHLMCFLPGNLALVRVSTMSVRFVLPGIWLTAWTLAANCLSPRRWHARGLPGAVSS